MAVISPTLCLECESISTMKVDRSKDVHEKEVKTAPWKERIGSELLLIFILISKLSFIS